MIIPDQTVKVHWSNRNKTYYTNLGYTNFENGKEFTVHINHLPPASRAEVEYICDYCGSEKVAKYNTKSNSKNHFCTKKCKDAFLIGKPSWNADKIEIGCSYCGKLMRRGRWELKRSKDLFCSVDCSNAYKVGKPLGERVKRLKLTCTYCSIPILRTEVELKRAKNHFCTKSCADKYLIGKPNLLNRHGENVNCHTCNKEFHLAQYRIESQERYFCTNNCRFIWMKTDEYSLLMKSFEKENNKIETTCAMCDKITFKYPSEIKSDITLCSSECRNEYLKSRNPNPSKEKIAVQCYTCEKRKFVHESVFKKNKFFFCTHDCYQQKRMEITDFKQTGTSIHRTINALLNTLKLNHVNEKGFGYYSLDIYLVDLHLGIEVMGDYWHGNPNKYNNSNQLNSIQIKNMKKDIRKRKFIEKKYNLKILYLWEYDIKNNLELCERLILELCNNPIGLNEFNSYNYYLATDGLELKQNITKPLLQ